MSEITLDPYGYTYNNPINLIDPTGMKGEDWYLNNTSGGLEWINGNKEVEGYTHLGEDLTFHFSSFIDRTLMARICTLNPSHRGGKFNSMLDNKYNMQNSIGQEYKHFLDDLGIRSKVNYGFGYDGIRNSNFNSTNSSEQRAIQYQRQLPSWKNTTNAYKSAIESYYKKHSN